MNTFLFFRYGIRMLYFFLIQSKSTNIENRVQIRSILYSFQPIRLQVFLRVSNNKFYKRTLTLILNCFKPFYNGFGIAPLVHFCYFSDFAISKFKISSNYSYFRFRRVSKSTFRIILEIYFVIFKSDKGFTLVELFYSIVKFKISYDGFWLLFDVVN